MRNGIRVKLDPQRSRLLSVNMLILVYGRMLYPTKRETKRSYKGVSNYGTKAMCSSR